MPETACTHIFKQTAFIILDVSQGKTKSQTLYNFKSVWTCSAVCGFFNVIFAPITTLVWYLSSALKATQSYPQANIAQKIAQDISTHPAKMLCNTSHINHTLLNFLSIAKQLYGRAAEDVSELVKKLEYVWIFKTFLRQL